MCLRVCWNRVRDGWKENSLDSRTYVKIAESIFNSFSSAWSFSLPFLFYHFQFVVPPFFHHTAFAFPLPWKSLSPPIKIPEYIFLISRFAGVVCVLLFICVRYYVLPFPTIPPRMCFSDHWDWILLILILHSSFSDSKRRNIYCFIFQELLQSKETYLLYTWMEVEQSFASVRFLGSLDGKFMNLHFPRNWK